MGEQHFVHFQLAMFTRSSVNIQEMAKAMLRGSIAGQLLAFPMARGACGSSKFSFLFDSIAVIPDTNYNAFQSPFSLSST